MPRLSEGGVSVGSDALTDATEVIDDFSPPLQSMNLAQLSQMHGCQPVGGSSVPDEARYLINMQHVGSHGSSPSGPALSPAELNLQQQLLQA